MLAGGDNPTIGLILCPEKTEAVACYSVLHESQQLFASRYRFTLTRTVTAGTAHSSQPAYP